MAFIRRKRVPKKLKNGNRYHHFYYYRVASVRLEGKVCQQVIAYLGDAAKDADRLAQEEEVSDREVQQLQQLLADEQQCQGALR